MGGNISTEKDYLLVLCRINEIFSAEKDTEEGKELERLTRLIEDYESKHYPI